MKFTLTKAPMKSIIVIARTKRTGIIDETTGITTLTEDKIQIAIRWPSLDIKRNIKEGYQYIRTQAQLVKVGLCFLGNMVNNMTSEVYI